MTIKVTTRQPDLWDMLYECNSDRCPLRDHCGHTKIGWCVNDNAEIIKSILGSEDLVQSWHSSIRSEPVCPVFESVERLAYSFLKNAGIEFMPVPSGVAHLADQTRPLEIHSLHLNHCHGALWELDSTWLLQIREQDSFPQKRFTIFHEVFHILTHSTAHELPAHSIGHCQSNWTTFRDLVADVFACYVLMPRNHVERKWLFYKSLTKMSRCFIVPAPVMWLRLKRMGLL